MFHPSTFVFYDPKKSAAPLSSLLVPPYDVLSSADAERLKSKSPYNFAHLDLPEKSTEGYVGAAQKLQQWLKGGILIEDARPSYFLYELTFQLAGETYTRLGIMGVMDLSAYSEKRVFPHEKTLPGHITDRLELMRTTQCQLSPIFCMVSDEEAVMATQWMKWIQSGKTLVDMTDEAGNRHIITQVFDQQHFHDVDLILQNAGEKVMIVDGHHRYETALQFQKENLKTRGNGRWNHCLTYLCAKEDPGLILLPYHRRLHSLPQWSDLCGSLAERLKEQGWTVETTENQAKIPSLLSAKAGTHHCIAVLEPDLSEIKIINRPKAGVDVEVFHKEILEKVLGLTKKDIDQQLYIDYIKGVDWTLAMKSLEDSKTQALFLFNACSKQEVFDIATSGRTLPQKSTFFYPKILSGVAIYRF